MMLSLGAETCEIDVGNSGEAVAGIPKNATVVAAITSFFIRVLRSTPDPIVFGMNLFRPDRRPTGLVRNFKAGRFYIILRSRPASASINAAAFAARLCPASPHRLAECRAGLVERNGETAMGTPSPWGTPYLAGVRLRQTRQALCASCATPTLRLLARPTALSIRL
jgi:hypothetical protein